MDAPDFTGTTPDVPAAPMWPAAPVGYEGVWPPRPTDSPEVVASMPFKVIDRIVCKNMSDVRTGGFRIDSEAITVDGKSMVRREIYYPVMICALLLRMGVILAYVLMRYAFLQSTLLRIPWQDISQVVLVPKRRWVGIAYTAPNYKGKILPFSMGCSLLPADYDTFVHAAQKYAPGRVTEGKLKAYTSTVTWIILAVFVALIVFAVIAGMGSPSR